MKRIYLAVIVLSMACPLHAQFIINDGISIVNTADIIATGDWENDGTLLNNGSITFNDNWTNLGTYDAAGNGKIVLSFATGKIFDHNGQSVGTLVKEGAGNAQIVGNVLVEDSLFLNEGRVLFSFNDTLLIAPTAFLQSNSTSYVSGHVTQLGPGTKSFPVGDASYYLPITLTNIAGVSPKVTASIENFPGGYSAGAGIDSLINFPIAWRVDASAQTDTASYIQFGFPESLLTVPATAVAARDAGNATFEGMGKRNLATASGTTTIISYSKGLRGLFTIAAGFAGNLATDSLALVTFYNNTGASAWIKDANWLAGGIGSWEGVTETGGSITSLVLDNANISGAMPDALADILSLQTVNVTGNTLTYLPDFSNLTALTTLNVSDNTLDFASLEYNVGIPGVNYSNQKVIGTPSTELVDVGTAFDVVTDIGGTANAYVWKKNGNVVSGAINSIYNIASIDRTNMGIYDAEITNSLVPGLTLNTAPITALAVATLSGTLFAQEAVPAASGNVQLLKVTTTGAYEPKDTVLVNSGVYTFEKVVLDDYVLFAAANTVTHPLALPSYYGNTIFWEEATTLVVNANATALDIVSAQEPAPPVGNGILDGFLEEEDGTGRVEKTTRVAGSGVTARRSQGVGRDEEVTYTLVAYTITDENGEFKIENLPQGEYRLNIQFPGYPMDSLSFIDFIIGTALEANVSVAALIDNNEITVRKRIVTDLFEEVGYKASVYPNPSVETITIQFEKAVADRSLILLDVNGKPLKEQPATDLQESMNVKEVASGTYLLRVLEKNATKKIIRVVIE